MTNIVFTAKPTKKLRITDKIPVFKLHTTDCLLETEAGVSLSACRWYYQAGRAASNVKACHSCEQRQNNCFCLRTETLTVPPKNIELFFWFRAALHLAVETLPGPSFVNRFIRQMRP